MILISNVNFYIFIEYFDVVENALSTYNPECVTQIRQANQKINVLLRTTEGKNTLETKFK